MHKQFLAGVLDPTCTGSPSPIYEADEGNTQTFTNVAILPASDCAVVWLPQRSPSSIFVMAKIATSVGPNIDASNGNPTNQTRYITIGPWQVTDPANHANDPYVYLVLNEASLTQNWFPESDLFRGYRPYNAMLQLRSGDPAGTSVTAGNIHAFSIADIRNFRSLDITTLASSCLSAKDAVLFENANAGIVTFLGPDIPLDFIAASDAKPNEDTYSLVGNVYPSVLQPYFHRGIVFLAPGFGFTLIGAAGGGPVDEVRLPDFPWFECVDYEIYFGTTGVSSATTIQTDYITACDIFAYHSTTIGAMTYDVDYVYYHPCLRPGGANAVVSFFPVVHHHRCRINSLYTGTRRDNRQYVGTYFAGLSTAGTGGCVQIQPVFRSVYSIGCTGPARILVCSSIGQPVQLKAVVNTQLKATSAIAPFKRSHNSYPSMNMNILAELALAYAGPSMVFRRVRTVKQQDRLVKLLHESDGYLNKVVAEALPISTRQEADSVVVGDISDEGYIQN